MSLPLFFCALLLIPVLSSLHLAHDNATRATPLPYETPTRICAAPFVLNYVRTYARDETSWGLCEIANTHSHYMPMCLAQQKVLQACPEFTNDWCYLDQGGSQVLKSPCPDYLTCHYCLGMNPLHCATAKTAHAKDS